MHSLKKFIPEWDLRTDSPSVLAHHRAYDDVTRDPEFSNKMIRRYLERYAWVPEEFEDFVYMSQWFQAEAVKTAMEAHRRAKPYCMGTLFWQINDCWPSVSWSSIDYYGRWKALHYYAKRAYAPVIISPYSFNDDTVRVMVVSDMSEEFRGKAEAYILDFDGKVISHQSKDVTVGAEGVKDFFDIPVVMLDGDRVLYVRLISQDRIIADNTYYSRFANSYSYGDAEIVTQVEAAEGGYMIKVSTDRLVRGLYLYTDNENDIFQDNHMDLIPGFGRTIYVESDTPKKEFITTLKYHTL
jgi:beta-mannosidase